jgi:arabinan endo-1,5-alpha-L-arabinosidase
VTHCLLERATALFLLAVIALSSTAEQLSPPDVPMGKRPSGTHEAPDPTIAREGEWYYVFSTGAGIPVRRSKDLIDWKMLPSVFPEAVPAWTKEKIPKGSGGDLVWAPDILRFNGRYFLYYSVSTLGSQRSVIGLATATTLDPDSPRAGWHDEGMILESFPEKDPYNAIDPSMCVDKEGNPWLVWGSYWSGIYLARINPATGRLLEGASRHHIAARRPAQPQAGIEGPIIIRKNRFYYLFVSHDDMVNYNVKVGRSATITGPYLDRLGRQLLEGYGTPVIAPYGKYRGTGHNGLLIDECPWFDVIVHHTLMPESRDLQVRPLFWSRDGWPLAGEVIQKTPPGPAEPVTGKWIHQVGWKDVHQIEFHGDGTLTTRNGAKGTWKLEARNLTMRWMLADGFQAVDECVLGPDGSSYVGRNALDTDIRGWRDQNQPGAKP